MCLLLACDVRTLLGLLTFGVLADFDFTQPHPADHQVTNCAECEVSTTQDEYSDCGQSHCKSQLTLDREEGKWFTPLDIPYFMMYVMACWFKNNEYR